MSNLYKFPLANASTSYGGGGAEPDIALLKFFTKPSLNKTNFDYSTSAQSPTILNFDSRPERKSKKNGALIFSC